MYDHSELFQHLPPCQQPANLPEHWHEATLEAKIYAPGLPPQLVINGDPMPFAYVPPDCSMWEFKPGAGGNSIWEHLPRLANMAACCGVIVEIGIASMTGSTHAFDLGLQASEVAPGRKFHIGIDIHETVAGPWVPASPFWQYVSGSSQDAATVEKVRQALTLRVDGGEEITLPIDILYIDTVHEYEFLKKELETWLPLIGPHTLVLFHDTHRGGNYDRMTDAIMEMVEDQTLQYVHSGEVLTPRKPAGPLYHTHQYDQISTTCEGLGALVPKAGWPK